MTAKRSRSCSSLVVQLNGYTVIPPFRSKKRKWKWKSVFSTGVLCSVFQWGVQFESYTEGVRPWVQHYTSYTIRFDSIRFADNLDVHTSKLNYLFQNSLCWIHHQSYYLSCRCVSTCLIECGLKTCVKLASGTSILVKTELLQDNQIVYETTQF